MAYQAGDTILDDQYNTFVNSSSSPFGYNHFAGTGSTVYGLGQTHIGTVGVGETITASQWNTLFTSMDNIANHTADTLASRALVSAGDTIAIKAAVEADLATLAASVAAGCPNTTALTTSAAKQTSSASSAWYSSHVVEHSVTFADADTMRHFFNAGGKIRITGDRTGTGTSGTPAGQTQTTTKDAEWDNLFAGVGNLDIGAQSTTRSGNTETVSTNGLDNGFHDLGTGYTVLLKLSDDTSPYGSNYIEISAKLDAVVGTAVTMTVKYDMQDGSADDSFETDNTDGIDSEVDRVGVTRVRSFVISPNNSAGLASNITESSTFEVSNTTTVGAATPAPAG
jgi:hypothetical protein